LGGESSKTHLNQLKAGHSGAHLSSLQLHEKHKKEDHGLGQPGKKIEIILKKTNKLKKKKKKRLGACLKWYNICLANDKTLNLNPNTPPKKVYVMQMQTT
jgi:hypothetical protein